MYPSNTNFRQTLRAVVIGMLFSIAAPTFAAPIELTYVRDTGDFLSMGYDASTGSYYSREDDGFRSSNLMHYNDINDFRSGTVSSTTTLPNWGTYLAVRDGKHFGRQDSTTNGVVRTDIATGSQELSVNLTGLGGSNGRDSFGWGGFSALNFYNTASGMYLLSGNADSSGAGSVLAIDNDFNITDTIAVPRSPFSGNSSGDFFGYNFAFVINDYMFLGDAYRSRSFQTRVDLLTGAIEMVDFEFTAADFSATSDIISNVMYDHLSDTLFFAETVRGSAGYERLHELTGAAAALGAVRVGVPEPGTMALMGIGFCALLARRRSNRTG